MSRFLEDSFCLHSSYAKFRDEEDWCTKKNYILLNCVMYMCAVFKLCSGITQAATETAACCDKHMLHTLNLCSLSSSVTQLMEGYY